jgi:hypothetical protein
LNKKQLKVVNPSEINNKGLKLMVGDIKIQNLLSMKMALCISPAVDISSLDKKCLNSNNGLKMS